MKGHLLFGTSHMLPFIVAGGVLLALAVMASGKGAQNFLESFTLF